MVSFTITREQSIPAPPAAVFAFLTDPNKIPLVMPGLIENTQIPDLPLSVGAFFHYRYQMYGVVLNGNWTVTAFEPSSRYTAKTDGDIESTWEYELEERDGATHLTFQVTYTLPDTVLAKVKESVMRSINEKEAELYMSNLVTVLGQ